MAVHRKALNNDTYNVALKNNIMKSEIMKNWLY